MIKSIFCLLIFISASASAQRNQWHRDISIGSPTLNAASVLDVNSTIKGSTPCPVMTEVQRDLITTPPKGLCVFNSTSNVLNSFDGTVWIAAGGGGGGGDLWSDPVDADVIPDADNSRNFGSVFPTLKRFLQGHFIRMQVDEVAIDTSTNALAVSGPVVKSSPLTATLNPSITLQSHSNNSTSTNPTGNTYVLSGNKTNATADSGDIIVSPGSATGTRGKIVLADGTEGTVGHVWTSSDATGEGGWAAAGGGGGATVALDNLVAVDIGGVTVGGTGHIEPDVASTYDLGTNGLGYNIVRANELRTSSNSLAMEISTRKLHNGNGTESINFGNLNQIIFTGDLDPVNNNARDLGNATFNFKDVHAKALKSSDNILINPTTELSIQDGSQGTIGHVWTSTDVTGGGAWAAAGGGGGDLWSDAVDSDIIATGATSTYDLGSTTDTFAQLNVDDINIRNISGTENFLSANNGTDNVFQVVSNTSMPSAASVVSAVSTNVAGGNLGINSGNLNSGAITTGDLNFETGNQNGSGNSGDINLTIGTAAGTQGDIKLLKNGVPSVIGQLWTATGVAGEGYWATPSAVTNKMQRKILTADVSTNGEMTDITFNNLVIGKEYEVRGQLFWSLDFSTSDGFIQVTAANGTITLQQMQYTLNETTDTSIDSSVNAFSFTFTCTTFTTLKFTTSSMSAGGVIRGSGTRAETYVELEERNDLVQTTDFN